MSEQNIRTSSPASASHTQPGERNSLVEEAGKRRRLFVFRITVVVALLNILSLPYQLIMLAGNIAVEVPYFTVTGLALVGLGFAWWLAKKGHITFAAWLLLLVLNLNSTFGFFFTYTTLVSLLVMQVLAVMALMLIGPRAAYATMAWTIAIGSLAVALNRLTITGNVSSNAPKIGFDSLVLYFLIMLGTVWLAALLANSLNQALTLFGQQADQLAEALTELEKKRQAGAKVSEQLLAKNSDLTTSANQQTVGSQEQANAVVEATNALVELSNTARSIAQNADAVRQAAQEALALSKEVQSSSKQANTTGELGQLAVKNTLEGIDLATNRMDWLAEKMSRLDEQSRAINAILGLINEIADETHLLALNAALEAAGAGENGDRFAVVAGRVKSLADSSRKATREVQKVVVELQDSVTQSVQATQEARTDMFLTLERSQGAGQVIEELSRVIEQANRISIQMVKQMMEMSHYAQEIGTATKQQESASEQIVSSMRDIGEVAEQNAIASSQVADAAIYLKVLSADLNTALMH